MTPDLHPERLRSILIGTFPELAGSRFTLQTAGWDCLAVDVEDSLIFKFPRHAAAERALATEAGLLALIRPAVTLPVPAMSLHEGPPLFSRHRKLPGEHLVTAQYERLPPLARERLAVELAGFYAELHGLDTAAMEAAGAGPIRSWPGPEEILRRAWPVLPEGLRRFAETAVARWQDLPPDPLGTTYGYFDGHGWNMAFDHERERLNGLYDFGDSGLGGLHQEFIYSNWIARDLTARLVTAYERLTGLTLDRDRIELLSGLLRLAELADYADDPEEAPAMIGHVAEWVEGKEAS